MLQQVVLHATGTPEVMHLEPAEPQVPGPGEVWLTQGAIGVNPLDVSQRKGAVRIPARKTMPPCRFPLPR